MRYIMLNMTNVEEMAKRKYKQDKINNLMLTFERYVENDDEKNAIITVQRIFSQGPIPKSHSKWKWNVVCKHLKLDKNTGPLSWDDLTTSDADVKLAQQVLTPLRESLNKHIVASGDLSYGKEIDRFVSINTILTDIVYYMKIHYKDSRISHMRLNYEHPINGIHSHGPVEFVITSDDMTILIVEAKKDNKDQGMAQLLMQLSCIAAIQKGNVYGFVSMGYMWIPVYYNSNDSKFYEYKTALVLTADKPKDDELIRLVSIIHYMIRAQF